MNSGHASPNFIKFTKFSADPAGSYLNFFNQMTYQNIPRILKKKSLFRGGILICILKLMNQDTLKITTHGKQGGEGVIFLDSECGEHGI